MAVAGYEYRVDGGSPVDVGNVLSALVTGLTPDTEYTFEVRAYDTAGNRSAWSDPVTATTDALPPGPINVALASNGATATDSSNANPTNFDPSRCIDGYRNTNNNWNSASTPGGGWASNGNPSVGSPEWVEVDFGMSRTIEEIDVFGLADAVNYTTDPILTDIASSFALVDFKTQYWNGSSWVDINTVTGNDKVWKQFAFSPITTTKIRLLVTSCLGGNAICVELEAWGN